MKYRKHSKIKLKHGLIDELGHFLHSIEMWPEIDAIIPGPIRICRHNDNLLINIRNIGQGSLKVLAKSHGAIQEVYFISNCPESLKQKLEEHMK